MNGDIEATATLEVGGATTLSSTLDVSGNTEMTGTLSVGGSHADTTKELYVNGDIEATATLEVGTDASVGGDTVMTGKLAVGGPVSGGTTKKLYVTGDIESTATLVVGTDASVGGNTVLSGTLNAGATTRRALWTSRQHRDDRDAVCGRHACRHHQGAVRERRHRGHRHPGGGGRHDAVKHSDVTGNTEMTDSFRGWCTHRHH